MEFQKYPKWVYRTDGPQESYEPGMEPVLVENEQEEAALLDAQANAPEKRRRNPAGA